MKRIKRYISKWIVRAVVADFRANGEIRQLILSEVGSATPESLERAA